MKRFNLLNHRAIAVIICALSAGVLVNPGVIRAEDYIGADALLRQVAEGSGKAAEKPKATPQSILRTDLKAFNKKAASLAPDAAAKEWLQLLDRAEKIQRQSAGDYNPEVMQLEPADILGALPPPADWSELAKAIAARPPAKGSAQIRESGLRLLAAALTGDTNSRAREITNLQAEAQTATGSSSAMYKSLIQQYNQIAVELLDDTNAVLTSLERQLATANTRGPRSLMVPNLVSQVGPEKAEAFLRKALVTPNITLVVKEANQTSKLAQKLALELMDQLKSPQWGLVNSLDSLDLYEALDKKFGKLTNSLPAANRFSPDDLQEGFISHVDYEGGYAGGGNKLTAQLYYMLGLIGHDRAKDAVAVAKKFNGSGNTYYFANAFKAMQRAGYTGALEEFLHELLSQDPASPFWDEYVDLAAAAGRTDKMLALVRDAIAKEDLSDNKKAGLHRILFRALLAADNVDDGVNEMHKLMASDSASAASREYNNGQLGVMLARIGYLLHNDKWSQEGIDAVKKWLDTPAGQNFSNGGAGSVVASLAQVLLDLKRGPEAEALLARALPAAIRVDAANNYSWNGGGARQLLTELAVLYHKVGKDEDVLKLLSDSPDWQAKDLSELFDSSFMEREIGLQSLHNGASPLPVPYLAANALVKSGQKQEAAKITGALLDRDPGLDRGYELLIALNGTNAVSKLDELFARDQFEERPLIWKAHLLREMDQLAAAEKTVRQAIAIDPSDGEEGKGDRMRAYAELAEILQAQGNLRDANFYREVVKAIRLSEDADDFYIAGLLKRAVAMYEDGLKHFSDAYCIQSRLAVQLSALGLNEEAEAHYRRAYELMPDSFGRVESHCFGCEGAFSGEQAQGIAEKVFTKLAAERPDKPQVHYLLGFLRAEEERYNEAATNYLQAVRLDPDYLNAWEKLNEVSGQIIMPADKRDEITFNLLRLDPLQRHHYASFNQVRDLTALWNAVAAAASHEIPVNTNLMTLTASKATMDKKPANANEQRMEMYSNFRQDKLSPAGAVASTPLVQFAGQMIWSSGNGLMDE